MAREEKTSERKMFSKETFVRVLQGWVCLIGVTALGNTLSCFVTPSFIGERLYTGAGDQASALAARLFGMWTLVSALLRIYSAIYINNRQLYNLTFLSFIIALVHFGSELLYFKTALTQDVGVVFPLIISSISLLLMIGGYVVGTDKDSSYSSAKDASWRNAYTSEDNMPRRVEDIQFNFNAGKSKTKKVN